MRSWLRASWGLVIAAGLSGAGHASDLASMVPDEIGALQHRLTDAGCYKGAVDGQASAATAEAVKACPDQKPMLRIETGMHVAPITRVGVDAGCKLLATGSFDKTVRLWTMPEGNLLRTVRLPIDDGIGGMIDAVALSPDGRTLAAGGPDVGYQRGEGASLYVVDLAHDGVRRLGPFKRPIFSLDFSADGARVGLGLGGDGIRVFDRATGRELMRDRAYGDSVYGIAFGPNGSLFSTSMDGFLRRYWPNLELSRRVKMPGGGQPSRVAVDPTGRRVAVGYENKSAVAIFDAATLKLVAPAETRDVTMAAAFDTLTWTDDGRQLVAGGQANQSIDGAWRFMLRRFDAAGKRQGPDVPAADSTIFDLKPCGSGAAFVSGGSGFGLMDDGGRIRMVREPVAFDALDKVGDAFTISADATSVRFGLGRGQAYPVLFDLAAGTLSDSAAVPPSVEPASVDGLPVTDWKNGLAPKLGGMPLALEPGDRSRALAVRSDRTGFVLGTSFMVHAFDAAGKARWQKPVEGEAWGVNLGAEGAIVVVVYGDGTVRWLRWSDGQELLALFVHKDTKAWVAWTPTGYYMASPGGEDLIGWHVNRGWEQEADFFPASRFRDRFNRPDIVRLVLKTLDEGEAVLQANAAAHRRNDAKPLIERLPPIVTILSPQDGASVAPGAIEVRYAVRLPSGGTVDRVEAFLDGAKVEVRGLARVEAATADGAGTIDLPMPAHDAIVSLVAYAGGLASDAARVQLTGMVPTAPAATGPEADALKPSLYALLVGVSHYENKAYDLGYPAADAVEMAAALKGQEGKLYRHVEVKVLTDHEATATGMKRGLTWLRKQTTAHDLAVLFAAGHGMTDAKGKFWFLTADADTGDLLSTAVSQEDIANVLYDLPGKKLLFLDACHSGAALNAGTRGLERSDVSAAVNDFAQAEGGVVAYAASTGREFSLERPEWGHGAFTKALIEGFGGRADLLGKGTVTTATLDLFVETRVKELTDGQQHPVMTRPKTVPDFPIATIR